MGDEHRHHFGIGLAFKLVALGCQFFPQTAKILDNAVMHHGHLRRGMGVGIGRGGGAMRGPARVANARFARQRVFRQAFLQRLEFAFGPTAIDFAIRHRGDAGGVITPVFKPLKRLKYPFRHRACAHYSNNSTHAFRRRQSLAVRQAYLQKKGRSGRYIKVT